MDQVKTPTEFGVDENNFVNLAIVGDLSEDKLEALSISMYEFRKLVENMHGKMGRKVKILVDLTRFSGKYAVKSFSELVNSAKLSKPHIEKSALFGGSFQVKLTVEAVIALSQRENMKIFETKQQALEWLSKPL